MNSGDASHDPELLSAFLDSLAHMFVFVDRDHVIRYMNRVAVERMEEGEALIGRSIFDCHNEESCRMIHEVFAALEAGEDERLITDDEKQRIYMRAVRDPAGRLLGYYERYEPPRGA